MAKKPTPAPAAPAVNVGGIELAKRISTKLIMGGMPVVARYESEGENKAPDAALVGTVIPQRRTELYTVAGIARDFRTGTTDKGDWFSVIGDFMASRTSDGKKFRAGQCFLPDVAGDILIQPVMAAKEAKETIQFGFRVGITSDPTAATGYVYWAEPLLETAPNDPLELLAQQVGMSSAKQISDQSEGA